MPVSRPEVLSDVMKWWWEINPCSVLDIGMGFGKMGVLFREAMDIRWGRYTHWQNIIDGVEIFDGYANPIWDYVYDKVFRQDVRTMDFKEYDVIFLGDVIEHFKKKEALSLLDKCMAHAKYVLVTTPTEVHTNKDCVHVFHNMNERHLSFLEDSDFPADAKITSYKHQKLVIITCKPKH